MLYTGMVPGRDIAVQQFCALGSSHCRRGAPLPQRRLAVTARPLQLLPALPKGVVAGALVAQVRAADTVLAHQVVVERDGVFHPCQQPRRWREWHDLFHDSSLDDGDAGTGSGLRGLMGADSWVGASVHAMPCHATPCR